MSPLEELRHSASHILATAVLRLFPDAKLDIGPPTETGFYYDIDLDHKFTADDLVKIEAEMKDVKHHLKHLTEYAVAWFETLQDKYGKGHKRRTTYDEIEQINAAQVVSVNQRLYVNREEGFIGLNWRQHEFVQDCSVLDSVLCLMRDGSLKVTKVADKVFMGRDIVHCAVSRPTETRIFTRWSTRTAHRAKPSPNASRSAASRVTNSTRS